MSVSAVAAFVSASLADPVEPRPLLNAMVWIEGTALGTIATIIAVLVVAGIGLSMLTGRIHWRRGLVVITGCFVVFGARGIADGILNMARGTSDPAELADKEPAPSPLAAIPKSPTPPPAAYDPYAGASVPPR